MNIFEEFNHLAKELETRKVRYALVGGVAVAFYTEPRFTRDIDLLIDSVDYDKVKGLHMGWADKFAKNFGICAEKKRENGRLKEKICPLYCPHNHTAQTSSQPYCKNVCD